MNSVCVCLLWDWPVFKRFQKLEAQILNHICLFPVRSSFHLSYLSRPDWSEQYQRASVIIGIEYTVVIASTMQFSSMNFGIYNVLTSTRATASPILVIWTPSHTNVCYSSLPMHNQLMFIQTKNPRVCISISIILYVDEIYLFTNSAKNGLPNYYFLLYILIQMSEFLFLVMDTHTQTHLVEICGVNSLLNKIRFFVSGSHRVNWYPQVD